MCAISGISNRQLRFLALVYCHLSMQQDLQGGTTSISTRARPSDAAACNEERASSCLVFSLDADLSMSVGAGRIYTSLLKIFGAEQACEIERMDVSLLETQVDGGQSILTSTQCIYEQTWERS
jgi:hypothetical protein